MFITDSSHQDSRLQCCGSLLGVFSLGLFITSIIVLIVLEPRDQVSSRIFAAVLLLMALIKAWIAYRLYTTVTSPCTVPSLESAMQPSAENHLDAMAYELENQTCVTDSLHGRSLQWRGKMTEAPPPPYEETLDPSQPRGADDGASQFFPEHNPLNIASPNNKDFSYLPSYEEAIMTKTV